MSKRSFKEYFDINNYYGLNFTEQKTIQMSKSSFKKYFDINNYYGLNFTKQKTLFLHIEIETML